jgi:hypothetical protein
MHSADVRFRGLLAYYEGRRQVVANNRLGGRHRLAGPMVKEYANRLKGEMDRRRMQFKPMDWPAS